MNSRPVSHTKYVVLLSIFIAFVIVFQVFGSYFRVGTTNLSLVLVPIVLGGIVLGRLAGLILGFAFSSVVFIMGVTGVDPFTNLLFVNAPFGTVFLIFAKGILAGYIPALVYKLINNKKIAVFVSSILAPIINTGIFIAVGLMLSGVLQANFDLNGNSVIYFLVIGCAGVNFIIELAINIVVSPAVLSVVKITRKKY